MRRSAVILCLIVTLGAALAATAQRRLQLDRPRQDLPERPRAQPGGAPIDDVVEAFYIRRLPAQVQLNDTQLAKVLPFLRQAIRERLEIAMRRTRTLNELRQLIQQGGSDDDVKRLVRDFDKADSDQQTSQEKFLANVDPLLTIRQQARLRVSLANIEQQLRRAINQAGGPAQPGPAEPPGADRD